MERLMMSNTRRLISAGLFAAMACTAPGQAGGPRPAFEVASVKLAPSPQSCPECRRQLVSDPGRIDYRNIQLVEVIRQAYGVTWELESGTGPASIWSERYDIQAKIHPDTSRDQVLLMLRTLLEERFKLVVHREKKQRPVYALVVGKSGLKISPASPEPERTQISSTLKVVPGGYSVAYDRISMERFAMSMRLDRPVVDMTGIEGIFSFGLAYARDDELRAAPPTVDGGTGSRAGGEAPLPPRLPPFRKVLEDRLGLILEPQVIPVDVFIVDHAERVPIEN